MTTTATAQKLIKMSLPWFESPFFEAELAAADLSEEEREHVQLFADNGYLVWEPEIPEFDELAQAIIDRLRPEHETHGSRIQDAWRFEPAVRRLASHPEVLKKLHHLYRRRPIPFQTLNFQRGTEQRTHSDLIHFNSLPHGFMAGVWFALEDTGPDNGPLHYYPGSHKLRVYELDDLGLSGSTMSNRDEQYMKYEDFLQALVAASGLSKETVTMKRGQALIWAANLMHGGEPIADPQSTRYSQVTHHYFEGCRYYAPLYSDPYLGRYSWREVVDVSTGRSVPHVYNGREVRLPVRTRARYFVEGKLRASELGRKAFARAKQTLKQ